MQLRYAIVLAIIATQPSNATSKSELNGWYPCSEYIFSDKGSSTGLDAQCAVYSALLCYPEICETPQGVNPKVDIFVKRLPVTAVDPDTAFNVWLLQGGPGASSTDLEFSMVSLHSELEGAVNVYTMDHRGTGRSTMLDCVAAQVTTTGSPWGNAIDPSEVPACAEVLQFKYGDLTSFSVTTAATDLATFISKFTNGVGTIVYGVSYGTMLAERLMHLSPTEVTGYVLDGIATTSGAPAGEFFYMTRWDSNFGEVGDAFLSLCERDSNCKFRFDSNSLNSTLQSLIDQFDHDPSSTCAALVNTTFEAGESPALSLRSALGSALMDSYARTLIPPADYRLERCAPEDMDILTQFFSTVNENDRAKTQDSAFESTLLYSLIVYSEMMESPLPSMSEMKDRFTGVKMSNGGGVYLLGPQCCAFSKEKSVSCEEINVGT
ncbi:hypothetical protein PC128_g5793 [Phytophthora cactorum]|nr:hypothetical protein PC128_g5793 [Phytophthora cactorum]